MSIHPTFQEVFESEYWKNYKQGISNNTEKINIDNIIILSGKTKKQIALDKKIETKECEEILQQMIKEFKENVY